MKPGVPVLFLSILKETGLLRSLTSRPHLEGLPPLQAGLSYLSKQTIVIVWTAELWVAWGCCGAWGMA